MTQSSGRSLLSRWCPAFCGLAAFAIVAGVFFVLDEPWTLRGDNMGTVFPMNLEAFRAWSSHRAPEWSGFWFGFPLLSDPISMSLYWPNLLAFLATDAPYLRVFDLATALHSGVLVAGVVWLLELLGVRRSVSLFGGALILLAPMHVWYGSSLLASYAAISWWPWALVAAEQLSRRGPRGRFFVLGWIALASSLVASPVLGVCGGLVAAGWVATRSLGVAWYRRAAFAAVLVVGGTALAAPQLVPAVFFHSRTAAPTWSADAGRLVFDAADLLYPTRTEPLPSFLGIWTLLLVALGVAGRPPRGVFLVILAALSFFASFVAATPVDATLGLLAAIDPFFAPMQIKLVTELALVLLAALALESLLTRNLEPLTPSFTLANGPAQPVSRLTQNLDPLTPSFTLANGPARPVSRLTRDSSGFSRKIVLFFGLMVVLEHVTWVVVRVPSGAGLPGDGEASFSERFEQMMDSGLIVHATRVTHPPAARVMDAVGLAGLPMIEGVPLAGSGRDDVLPARYRKLTAALMEPPGPSRPQLDSFAIGYFLDVGHPATRRDPNPCLTLASDRGLLLAGMHHDTCLFFNRDRPLLVNVPQRVRRVEDVASMVENLDLQLRRQSTVLTYLPAETECVEEKPETLLSEAIVQLFQHKLRDQVAVVAPPGVLDEKVRSFGRATMVDYQPGRIVFSTSVNKPGFAVVRESYFDGWQALVDGEPAPVYPAAGLFFAVPVPPGKSDVVVTYHAPGWRIGLQIALAWVVLASLFELLRRIVEQVRAGE